MAYFFATNDSFTNIRRVKGHITIHCNSGTWKVHHAGELKTYVTVWYDENGIANISSLSKVKNKLPVRYNTATSNTFVVTKSAHEVYFREVLMGLYFSYTNNRDITLITAKDKMEGYTQWRVGCAEVARYAQQIMEDPSMRDFKIWCVATS